MFVYPYKKGSKSAKVLAKALRCKALTRPKLRRKGPVVNWGSNKVGVPNVKVINSLEAVDKASSKFKSFEIFKANNIPCPDFTTDMNVAKNWIEDGEVVLCRTLLRSHSGKGIIIASTVEQLVRAPLYVKYFNKTYEFRVHVFNGKVIDSVQKRRRNETEYQEYNKFIRSHGNGWVFCRESNNITEDAKNIAVSAVKVLGLDFGAVDIVMKTNGKCKVLEVNTAPALEGTTLRSYVNAINEFVYEQDV